MPAAFPLRAVLLGAALLLASSPHAAGAGRAPAHRSATVCVVPQPATHHPDIRSGRDAATARRCRTASAAGAGPGAAAHLPPAAIALCLALLAGGVPASLPWRARRRARAARLIDAEIDRQAAALGIRRLVTLTRNRDGALRRERWLREKRRFCDSVLRPALSRRGLDGCWPGLERQALARIERSARRHGRDRSGFDPAMHPLAYERLCGRLLQRAGWTVRYTPASGDQGADILARRGGILLVVQCKLYRGAVGNEAVQQVAAARAHHGAQAAVVVSNSRYTEPARQLAGSNRVALLHHRELCRYRFEPASRTMRAATS